MRIMLNKRNFHCLVSKLEVLSEGSDYVPQYYFSEIWTPLKIVGIRLFRDDDGNIWIKFWKKRRRRLGT
jgi:hypothetical protein